MNKQEHLLEEIKDMIKELVQSNQMVIQTNNEIKQLLLGKLELRQDPSDNEHSTPHFMTTEVTNENVNADLFKRIAHVYFNEEIERIKSNNVRKSARRVSVELGRAMCDFLNQQLQGTGLGFSRFPDGLIIINHGEKWIGAIKIISDLGFHRGEQWFEYAEGIVNHCNKKYGITNDRIFFVISSLRNGLDQKHVEKLLNRDIRSNWEFMNNRTLVDEYVEKFTYLTTCLAEPRKQIYVLASELHPNVIADDLHKMNDEQKSETFKQIEEYDWILDLNDFLEELRHLI
ncbi:hypothetical protein ABHN11_12975 [Brevibacillus centrosporus]|uniref:hypothetical protein n=1 Tax=Brevibacillus centrosporus TaxID=54910 RepID=UPI003D1E3FBC